MKPLFENITNTVFSNNKIYDNETTFSERDCRNDIAEMRWMHNYLEDILSSNRAILDGELWDKAAERT